jgi:drug/metabolite transporter (DMT)-like permease
MPGNQRGRMAAVGSVVAAALLWSSSYAVTKKVLAEVGPLTIGAIRFTLAAGILFVVVRLRREGAAGRPGRRQRRAMYGTGLLGITVYFVLENIGVQLSVASDAALIVATYPLMTMVLERVVLRIRVPAHRIGGVLLAGAGAALVVRNGSEVGGSARWAGDLLLLAAGLAWAGYNIVTKQAGLTENAVTLTYYQTLAGAAGFLVVSLVEIPQWRMPGPADALLLVYLAAACSVGGFLFYNYGLRRMTSSAAVNILNLVPVCGVISAVLIDGETVRPIQLIGGAVIIAGVSIGVIDRTPASVTPARLL